MDTIVIEHVPVAELPQAWRDKLGGDAAQRVTVRIEAEPPEATRDPLFGMWRDREDMADVAAYLRSIRASRLEGLRADDKHGC
jgi:hypothetical protein